MLPDTDPPECQHCKQYGFDCTFFLPITETRFRKQRMEAMKAEEEEKDRQRVDVADSRGETYVDLLDLRLPEEAHAEAA